MILPACRYRGEEATPGRFPCGSGYVIVTSPDGAVSAATCKACPYSDAPPRPQATRAATDFPCVHRGPELRKEPCKLCGGRDTLAPVFACGKHGECTIHNYGLHLPKCMTCSIREEPEPD